MKKIVPILYQSILSAQIILTRLSPKQRVIQTARFANLPWFIIMLMALCQTAVHAQDDSGNRRKIINMVLLQSHVTANAGMYSRNTNAYVITSPSQAAPQGFRASGAIPRYCLAKGAVICRLEEYVQLHSPFKLNIGVGGE